MSGQRLRQSSLARQFAGSAAALAAVAVLLIAAGSWWWIDRLHQASASTLAKRDVELRAAQVGDTLTLIDERLREVAASPLLQTALTKRYVAWPRIRHEGGEEAYVRQIMVRANIDESRRPWRRERRARHSTVMPAAERGSR